MRAETRRQLARELTRLSRLPAVEAMGAAMTFAGETKRIGITGPPGAGKSSLIALLAQEWLTAGRTVGVIAIDPTSPLSGGSLLGDRIRMDNVADDPNIFIRSVSSGSLGDGLCPNICALLDAFERIDFEYLILETVGVGQVSYETRALVDTFVLVLVPESGDTVQAMKAGILEVADIYVINKADRPGSAKLAAELDSIAARRKSTDRWTPPVILTSHKDKHGAAELARAIEDHRDRVMNARRKKVLSGVRREYHIRSLITQRVDELLKSGQTDIGSASVRDSLRLIIDQLRKY